MPQIHKRGTALYLCSFLLIVTISLEIESISMNLSLCCIVRDDRIAQEVYKGVKQHGAAGIARRAHTNWWYPEVPRSKRGAATFFFVIYISVFHFHSVIVL